MAVAERKAPPLNHVRIEKRHHTSNWLRIDNLRRHNRATGCRRRVSVPSLHHRLKNRLLADFTYLMSAPVTPTDIALEFESPNEGFTEGGDLVLRTLDKIDFHVHSVILSLASPVLANMIDVGTKRDVVTVGETAEVLALMLSFIYPRTSRPVPSFQVLQSGMHVADKYQLDEMKNRLREKLSLSGSPVSMFKDPLGVLAFAIAHGFREEAKSASELLNQSCDFRKIPDLVKLITAFPAAASLIKLIGIPSAKAAILSGILFDFHRSPMRITQGAYGKLLCYHCNHTSLAEGRRSPPEWLARWSHSVFEELYRKPLSECSTVFKFEFLHFALRRDGLEMPATSSCDCLSSINKNKQTFEEWAENVRSSLHNSLAKLSKLQTA